MLGRLQVASHDVARIKAGLPYPWVYYPGHYGTFFAFRAVDSDVLHLCSCCREPIENYLRLRQEDPPPRNSDPLRTYVLDPVTFPRALVVRLVQDQAPSDGAVMGHLEFRDKLCHECNQVVPELRYCHPMYGGAFKQKHGWYINRQAYEFGLNHLLMRVVPDSCPEEIRELLGVASSPSESTSVLDLPDPKLRRRVLNVVENEVRLKFGHKRIGDAWTSETVLYHIVRTLLPNTQVLRHHRPDFLEGLELDIFLPEHDIGIEYQGLQHFEAVRHWGGREGLGRLQARDRRKKKLCRERGIGLVYFTHKENLSHELVRARLQLSPTPGTTN